jgi:hypothetical protein
MTRIAAGPTRRTAPDRVAAGRAAAIGVGATADAIAEQIINSYLPCFQQLRQRLKQRITEEKL